MPVAPERCQHTSPRRSLFQGCSLTPHAGNFLNDQVFGGGRLRSGYLHRRLAWETCGEVVFEDLWPDRAGEAEPAPRMILLTRMQALINAWRIRRGFSFDRPRLPRERREQGARKVQRHDYQWGRAGGPVATAANIITLDGEQAGLPE